MRQKRILTLIFLLVGAGLAGQVPPWDWVKSLHTNTVEVATDVVADPATGSVYMAGYWRGPLDSFIPSGGTPSTDFSISNGSDNGLVAKYTPAGNLLWAFKIGGGDHDHINAIHMDGDGNIYITGFVSPGTIHFAGTGSLTPDSVYTNAAVDDFFLAKYDPQGRLLWMRHSEGDNKIMGLGITSNTSGVYVTGEHKGTVSFGPLPPHNADGNGDMFVVKYSPDGDEQWQVMGSSNLIDTGEDITCDESHIYVTGEFEGEMLSLSNAAGVIMPGILNTTDGMTDIFLASYTIDGDHQWTSTISSPEDDYCLGVTMDNDSLYLVGSIGASALFPSFSENPVDHKNGQDAFICSISKLDGSTGWVITLADESGGDEVARDISRDIVGNLYVTGNFQGSIQTLYGSFVTKGDEDIFLASFTEDGKYNWIKTAGSTHPDFGNGVSATAPGSVYMAGDYSKLTAFDSIFAPDDVNQNIYLARLQLSCLDAAGGVLSTTDPVVCEADTIGLFLKNYYGDIDWQTSPPGLNSWSTLTADLSDSIALVPAATADFRAYLRSGTCAPDSSNIINVQVTPLPAANISGGIIKCDDGTTTLFQIDLSGSPPWELVILYNGVSDTTISGIGTNPYFLEVGREGTYTLGHVSDINCTGTVSGTASLIYLDTPTPDPGSGGNVCGLVFDLQAFPGFNSGSWSQVSGPGTVAFSPSPDSASVTVTATDFGSYEFNWTETNGSCTQDSSVVVRFFQQPVIAIIPGVQTCGLQYGLNVTVNTDAVGFWSVLNGPGNAVFLPDAQTPDALVEVNTFGIYNFQWTASNVVCTSTGVANVEFLELPEVDAGMDLTIDPGEIVQLTGTGGDSVIWTPDYRLTDPSIPDPFVNPLVTTTYYLTVFNSNGCAGTDSVTITVRPPDFADAGNDVRICPGDSTQLKASGGDVYKWNPTEGLDRADIPDPWAKPRTTTTYVVVVINADGLTDTDTVTVFVLTRPFVDAGDDQSICLGETAQLSASGVGDFLWNHPGRLSDASIPDPVATIDANTTFRVLITDSEGCRNIDSLTLIVYTPPVADAGPDQHHIAQFETSLEGRLGPDEKGTWSAVSGGGIFEDPHFPETRVTSLEIGDNIFAWHVSNDVCPEVVDQVKIQIGDFVIPTVITPNGDGKNDRFHVEGILEFSTSELTILNQWGEEVYHASPYVNDWNGVDKNGRELPEDTYYIILIITHEDIRKGYVMIIR